MSVIKPRVRGKHLVEHRTRLDQENHETLYAYAAFVDEDTRLHRQPTGRDRARERQGVRRLARGAPAVVRTPSSRQDPAPEPARLGAHAPPAERVTTRSIHGCTG